MSSTNKSNPDEFFQSLFSGQVAPGRVGEFKRENHQRIIEKWRKAFAKKLHDSTGEWRIGGYDWHVFTFGYAQALTGKRAIDNYHSLSKSEAYVFKHTIEEPLCCFTGCFPSYAAINHTLALFRELADVYVVDRDFKWTFVVTHENSSGIDPSVHTDCHGCIMALPSLLRGRMPH